MCYSCLARSHYVISYIVTRRSLGKDPARCLELTSTRKKKEIYRSVKCTRLYYFTLLTKVGSRSQGTEAILQSINLLSFELTLYVSYVNES